MKRKIGFSLDADTIARLRKIAAVRHMNMSQCITNWVWDFRFERDERDQATQKKQKGEE